MKITYHGHSFVELETDCSILIDPFITGNPLCKAKPDDFSPDAILLTHGHRDHYGDTETIAEKSGCEIFAMAELARWLSDRGLTASGFNIGGSFLIGSTEVKAVDARHSNSTPDGSYGGLACGFVVLYDNRTIYHAGDTSYFSDMGLLKTKFSIDAAFLPIGGTYTMGILDASLAAESLSPEICIPIHFNTFKAVEADVFEFRSILNKKGIKCSIMEPGSCFEI